MTVISIEGPSAHFLTGAFNAEHTRLNLDRPKARSIRLPLPVAIGLIAKDFRVWTGFFAVCFNYCAFCFTWLNIDTHQIRVILLYTCRHWCYAYLFNAHPQCAWQASNSHNYLVSTEKKNKRFYFNRFLYRSQPCITLSFPSPPLFTSTLFSPPFTSSGPSVQRPSIIHG